MIDIGKLTPEVYYKESRDFQLFGRIYDLLFNYVKTNVDLMENLPISRSTDTKLIELLCRTLGFENKTNFRVDDLNAICGVFIKLMKNKGTLTAIKILVATILNIEGVNKEYKVEKEMDKSIPTIGIYIPEMAQNPELKLLEDILEYITPAGVDYTIHNVSVVNADLDYIYTAEDLGVDAIAANDDKLYSGEKMVLENKHKGPEINPLIGDIRYSKLYKEEK